MTVGCPQRTSLYILSRDRQMDPVLYQRVVERAEAMGHDMSELRLVDHCPGTGGEGAGDLFGV
jgi:lipocalin